MIWPLLAGLSCLHVLHMSETVSSTEMRDQNHLGDAPVDPCFVCSHAGKGRIRLDAAPILWGPCSTLCVWFHVRQTWLSLTTSFYPELCISFHLPFHRHLYRSRGAAPLVTVSIFHPSPDLQLPEPLLTSFLPPCWTLCLPCSSPHIRLVQS
jgi:hypothetical protein